MADQNTILRILHEAPTGLLAAEEIAAGGSRKNVHGCLVKLIRRGLVARMPGRPVLYALTAEGIMHVEAGKRISSGPRGPRNRRARPRGDSFRGRLWRTLRMARKATIPDLVEIARTARDRNPVSNATSYMRALRRAGIVTVLPQREPGFAPTSTGFLRFLLIRDLGPLAPMMTRSGLYDPNSGIMFQGADHERSAT